MKTVFSGSEYCMILWYQGAYLTKLKIDLQREGYAAMLNRHYFGLLIEYAFL